MAHKERKTMISRKMIVTSIAVFAMMGGILSENLQYGLIADASTYLNDVSVTADATTTISVPDAVYPTTVSSINNEKTFRLTWESPSWKSTDMSKGLCVEYNKDGWMGKIDFETGEYIPSSKYDYSKKITYKNGVYTIDLPAKSTAEIRLRYYYSKDGKTYHYGKAKYISVHNATTSEVENEGYGYVFDPTLTFSGGEVNIVEVSDNAVVDLSKYRVVNGWFSMGDYEYSNKITSTSIKSNSVTLSCNINYKKDNYFIGAKRNNSRTYICGKAEFKLPKAYAATCKLTVNKHKNGTSKITGKINGYSFMLNKNEILTNMSASNVTYSGEVSFKNDGVAYNVPFVYSEKAKLTDIPAETITTTMILTKNTNVLSDEPESYKPAAELKNHSFCSVTKNNVTRSFSFRDVPTEFKQINKS